LLYSVQLKKINRTAELIFTFKILINKNFEKFKMKKDVNRGLIIRISPQKLHNKTVQKPQMRI
jgi:hypothetical protein